MSLQKNIKPISYLKNNAAQIASELKEDGEAYVITQNGEPAMVVQSVEEYERKENALAMLQVVAKGRRDLAEGNTRNAEQVFAGLRQKLNSTES